MGLTKGTCAGCKAEQDVTAEAKKVRDALDRNTFGTFAWKCKKCGTVNQGMVDAPLDR
jgi:rubrerythrin